MKFVGKGSLSFFIKWLILITMALTAVIIVFLPWVIDEYLKMLGAWCNTSARTVLLIVLYPSGICALFIENELRRLFKSLENKNPFVIENVKSLNRMGIFLIVIIVMFIFKIVMLNSIMTMLSAGAMVILSLFCFILADVFKQAVIYKEDNDLVI